MKHTKKKKLLAFVLCMILVLSTGISAFAYDNTAVQTVACQATKLEQPIKNADGKQIGTLTADVPEGAFHAASSGADIQMEVTANTEEADVLEQVQKLTEDTVGTSVVTDVTFYVDGQKQAPQQAITFQVTGTDLNAEKTAAFAENGKNTPELMDVAVADNGGLQFTAKASDAMTMTYGVFEKEAATEENDNDSIIDTQQTIAYEQTYSDDQVEIKVTAADGVLPEDAQLQVTPVVKTDITDTMSEEEKQAAEAVNAKYDTAEQKLNEKATDEAYGIAGFLAYDISFIDKDGNKVEPNGDVNVSMDYKEATIPETAQKVMEEKTDDVAMNVTLMHLEENAQGEVEKVVDMVADENEKANVEVTDTQGVQKAEFVSDSFSAFILTWNQTYGYTTADSSILIKRVDTNGVEIGDDVTSSYSDGDLPYYGSGNGTFTKTVADLANSKTITGYTFSKATLNSVNENAVQISSIKCELTNNWSGTTYTWKYFTNGTTWTNLQDTDQIYLVYTHPAGLYIDNNIAGDGSLTANYVTADGAANQITSSNVKTIEWYSNNTRDGYYQKKNDGTYTAGTY